MKVWYAYNFFDHNRKIQIFHDPEICEVLAWFDSCAVLSRSNGQIFTDGLMYLIDQSKAPTKMDAIKFVKSRLGKDSEPFIPEEI